MYLITYLDRVNISTAAPEISKEFGFDKITMGVIFSAFVWAYALFQVPGGWLGDRFGARRVLDRHRRLLVDHDGGDRGGAAAPHSSSCGSCSASAKPARFPAQPAPCSCGIRGTNAASCRASPTARAASAPPSRRRSWSLIMTTFGWRSVFYICGAAGLVWSVLWYLTYRNLPEEHGLVNTAELEHIRGLDANGEINPAPIENDRRALGDAAAIAQHVGDHVRLFHLRLLPLDLPELAAVLSGRLPAFHACSRSASSPRCRCWPASSATRSAAWRPTGCCRRPEAPSSPAALVAIVGLLGCAAFIVPAALTEDAYTAVYCLTGAMFFLECTIGPSWSVPMDVGGKYSGTVSGMMNMAGNIGGALSPMVFGYPGPVRHLAGAVHRRRRLARHRCRGVGVLARSRQAILAGLIGYRNCRNANRLDPMRVEFRLPDANLFINEERIMLSAR